MRVPTPKTTVLSSSLRSKKSVLPTQMGWK
jgi:hypothetical protein